MPEPRCSYFTSREVEVSFQKLPQPIRATLCRCVLVETLAARLKDQPQSEEYRTFLLGPNLDGHPRSILGPDLDYVSAQTCTASRQQQECIPRFTDVLMNFGLDTALPEEG